MIGREEEIRIYRDRVNLFYVITVVALGLILTRLFFLQIVNGEELRRYSEANRLKKERLFPTRGVIYDRNGAIIVDNRAAFDVVLFSQYYPFDDDKVNARLAKALKIPLEELERKLAKAKKRAAFHSILLRSDAPPDVLAAIEMDADGFPGVDVEPTVQRRYPYGDVAAQVLGYVGEVGAPDVKKDPSGKIQPGDYIGRMGIEEYYDKHLRGENGIGYVEVDSRGHRKKAEQGERLLGYSAQTDPISGHNLFLTIDLDVQLAAAKAITERGFNGTVVALDPRSGEILAMVSYPSYHPGLISGREIDPKTWASVERNPDRPLRNRAIQDHYSPGSTFKLLLAVAGLAEGVITTKSAVNCAGSMQFGSRKFHCWKRHGHTDFYRSIKESCDVFYYTVGDRLGVDKIAKYARLFGFGAKTGLKLSGEQAGLIPDSEWKQKVFKDIWHPGETLSVSIGQGYVTATPLQLVTAYAAIGNSGFVYRPYIVRKIEQKNGKTIREFQPELLRKLEIPSEIFEAVKEGLFEVVNTPGGTGVRSGSNYTAISGKTGTAQVRSFAEIMKLKCEQMPIKDRHNGLFVGYAPRENPEIAVVAVAEHACHGSLAGPLVKDTIEAYFQKKAKLTGVALVEDEALKKIRWGRVAKAKAVLMEEDEEVPAAPEGGEPTVPPPPSAEPTKVN